MLKSEVLLLVFFRVLNQNCSININKGMPNFVPPYSKTLCLPKKQNYHTNSEAEKLNGDIENIIDDLAD